MSEVLQKKRKNYSQKFCYICGRNETSVSYFKRFPSDKETRSVWLNFVNIPEDSDTLNLYLCSKHFMDTEVNKGIQRCTLTQGAVPTLLSSVAKKLCREIKCILCPYKEAHSDTRTSSRFPDCVTLKKKWAEFCGIPLEQIPLQAQLCSRHFHEEDFIIKQWMKEQPRKVLKKEAVPSIHLEDERRLQLKSETIRKQKSVCGLCGYNKDDTEYFTFPKNEERNNTWRRIWKLEDKIDTKKLLVCGRHFSEDEKIIHLNRTNLKATAVPSLNLGTYYECMPRKQSTRQRKNFCGLCGYNKSDTQYFKFPTGKEQNSTWRRIWKLEDKIDTKKLLVCGRHFPEDQKRIHSNRTNLKATAVPNLNLGFYYESSENEGTGTNTWENSSVNIEPGVTASSEENQNHETPASSSHDSNVQGSISETPSQDFIPRSSGSQLAEEAISASSLPTNATLRYDDVMGTPKHHSTPRTRKLRYFGDVRTPDLASPRRAKICWNIAKKTIEAKNIALRRSQEMVLRLQKKIRSLSELVEHLRSQKFIPENAAQLLTVRSASS